MSAAGVDALVAGVLVGLLVGLVACWLAIETAGAGNPGPRKTRRGWLR